MLLRGPGSQRGPFGGRRSGSQEGGVGLEALLGAGFRFFFFFFRLPQARLKLRGVPFGGINHPWV